MSLTKEQTEQFVSRWCEALRSGNYKQGTGRLRDVHDRFCCLGIACEVAKEFVDGITEEIHPNSFPTAYSYIYEDSFDSLGIPEPLRDVLNFKTTDGCYLSDNQRYEALTKDNDQGKFFVEIAEIIEKNKTILFPILS